MVVSRKNAVPTNMINYQGPPSSLASPDALVSSAIDQLLGRQMPARIDPEAVSMLALSTKSR